MAPIEAALVFPKSRISNDRIASHIDRRAVRKQRMRLRRSAEIEQRLKELTETYERANR